MEGGNLKLVSDETQNLGENEVLIKVHYSPVTNYDKACLSLCGKKAGPEFEFGSEGSGTIEAVGPGGE